VTRIRVVIADDHVVYREGIKTVLTATADDVDVVGEAGDGRSAIDVVAATGADVVLMDLAMPGMGGLEAIGMIARDHQSTAVVVLTMFDDDSVLGALRAGARGYLLKDSSADDLVRAIRAAVAGDAILAPAAATRLVDHLSGTPAEHIVFPELTSREHDVLRLVLAGRSNAEIGQTLFLSPKTVRNYVSTILMKLRVENRSQAIVKAREAGYPTERTGT